MQPLVWILISSLLWMAAVMSMLTLVGPAWDQFSAWQTSVLRPMMVRLRMNTGPLPTYLRLWGLSIFFAIVIIGGIYQMWVLATVAVVLIYLAPNIILSTLIEKRRRLLQDQMVSASIGLANASRAGLSLAQGLESICNEIPAPLSVELRQIVFDWKRGRPLIDSIHEVRERLNLNGFTLFALAIEACLERGGNISQALERISRSLTENRRLERKLEAETASGRKLVVILALFPAVFLGGFYFLDPRGISLLFSTVIGQIVLLIVIALVCISIQWCRKILNIDV